MPDKRATYAAERILLPRKVRENRKSEGEKERDEEWEILSISQRAGASADAPAIGERNSQSDLGSIH